MSIFNSKQPQTVHTVKDPGLEEKRSGKELPLEPNDAQERLDRESMLVPGAPANGDNITVELGKHHELRTTSSSQGVL